MFSANRNTAAGSFRQQITRRAPRISSSARARWIRSPHPPSTKTENHLSSQSWGCRVQPSRQGREVMWGIQQKLYSRSRDPMIDLTSHESGAANLLPEKFPLGRVVATPRALASISSDELQAALRRHHTGDWGDLDEDDRLENERSLLEGLRLLSSYETKSHVKFWIITEHDRSATTVLLPD